ncbi:hypothetical protein ES708_02270 [subsurface metagenome]
MAVELIEGEIYTVKATTTNMSTKAGVPVAATLAVNITAVVDSQTILDNSAVYGFAAGETQTFEFTMAVPMGAGGKAGAVVAEVLDPSGNKLADGSLDIDIAAVGPVILNGGFESGSFPPWVFVTNEGGRSGAQIADASRLAKFDVTAYEGSHALEMHASVAGRHIIMTATQAIPWSNSYRGLPFSVSTRAVAQKHTRNKPPTYIPGTIMRVEIDDGVSVSSSPSINTGIGAWQKVTANKIIAANATKLDIVLRCLPIPSFPGTGFEAFFDDVRIE